MLCREPDKRRGPARRPADTGAGDHDSGPAAVRPDGPAGGQRAASRPGRPAYAAGVGPRGGRQRADAGPRVLGRGGGAVRPLAHSAAAARGAVHARGGRAGQPGGGPGRLGQPERVRGRVPPRDRPDPLGVLQTVSPVWRAANASVSPVSSAVRLTARAPCPTWPSARSSTGRPDEVACCSAAHILYACNGSTRV